MKKLRIAACVFTFASAICAQSDRGTITGTVSDPARAVVAAASVQIKNVETGAVYQAGTSAGNYTLAQLPAGQYELTVDVPGFKKFVRKSVTVNVAETYRVDVVLEVGSNTESVTVTEAAPLLKTESGELSHTVATSTMNNLSVMSIGAAAGSSGIRNPYSVVQLLPGTTYSPDVDIRVNGLPANTQAMRIEGQDAFRAIANPRQRRRDARVHRSDQQLRRGVRPGLWCAKTRSRMVRNLDLIESRTLPFSRARGHNVVSNMAKALDPFRFVLIAVGGWINQRQSHVIEYLCEENRVLREQLGAEKASVQR